jgi:hypothetical protein
MSSSRASLRPLPADRRTPLASLPSTPPRASAVPINTGNAAGSTVLGNANALQYATSMANFKEATSSTQSMGTPTFNAGEGTVQSTFNATSATLTLRSCSMGLLSALAAASRETAHPIGGNVAG